MKSIRITTSAFVNTLPLYISLHKNHNYHHVSMSTRLSSSTTPTTTTSSSFPQWSYEPRDFFHYELIYQSKKSNARVGRIHTPHGIIDTPGYVAVATNGAIKGLDMRDADDAGQQLIFCNSYHLLLQPGPEIIKGKERKENDESIECGFNLKLYLYKNDITSYNAWVLWAAMCSRVIAQ